MTEIVKEHPLRAIVLNFDLRKPTPEFEQQGLDAYYTQHDKTWEAKQLLSTHKNIVSNLNRRILELSYQLEALDRDLQFIEFSLGLNDGTGLPPREDEFNIDIGAFRGAANAYIDAIHVLRAELADETDWHNAHAEFLYEHESFLPYDEASHNAIHQIFKRYEEVSVDIVSLDRDQEEWRRVFSEVNRFQDTYFEHAQYVFLAYEGLLERADAFFARVQPANELLIEKTRSR